MGSVVAACSGDEAQPARGALGESCESHRDCAQGLSCQNEVCAPGVFSITQSPTQCDTIQCRTAADCTNDSCELLKSQCDSGLSTTYCDQFAARCTFDCQEGNCVQRCVDPLTDPLSACQAGRVCNGSHCVGCQCDTDCQTGFVCRGETCWPECETDVDCDGLTRCDDGVCVSRNCANDRECVAALSNPLAVCREGQCQRTCTSDLECDESNDFNFMACVSGVCAPLGCISDDECRAYEHRDPILSPSLDGSMVIDVCRAPVAAPAPGARPSAPECGTGGTGGSGGTGGTAGNGGSGGIIGTGDCCQTQLTPGCGNPTVQNCVCNDWLLTCCQAPWNSSCVFYATNYCGGGCAGAGGTAGNGGTAGTAGSAGTSGGGSGGTGGAVGNCCTAHNGLGCDNDSIEACVCSGDPICCSTGWDSFCVARVESDLCGDCP